eukprot:1430299-Pyramimonas_sp.AAC.1
MQAGCQVACSVSPPRISVHRAAVAVREPQRRHDPLTIASNLGARLRAGAHSWRRRKLVVNAAANLAGKPMEGPGRLRASPPQCARSRIITRAA